MMMSAKQMPAAARMAAARMSPTEVAVLAEVWSLWHLLVPEILRHLRFLELRPLPTAEPMKPTRLLRLEALLPEPAPLRWLRKSRHRRRTIRLPHTRIT